MIRFGTAGNPDRFYESGKKKSIEMPAWLKEIGLSAYEYQCSKGVKITEKTAQALGEAAKENDIFLSVHAPYYISLSSVEPEKRDNSITYILKTLEAAKHCGAKRIVVHAGSCSKMSREEALALACETLKRAAKAARELHLDDIAICPETMGKINQLGTVDEVIEMCKVDESFLPCVDFGHVNAREMGSLNALADFEAITDKIHKELGEEKGRKFHVHFTRIAFTAGGEKCHIPYSDESFGPAFDPFAELIYKKNLEPVVICESPGMQDLDALTYQNILEGMKNAN